MVKKQTLTNQGTFPVLPWEKFCKSLEKTNDAMQAALNEVHTYPEKSRLRDLLKYWQKVIDNYNSLTEAMEEFEKGQKQAMAIEIINPWETDTFSELWQEWKLYLLTQHKTHLCGITEKKQLEYLKECTDGNEENAKNYLNYAMRNLYKNFFKVKERDIKTNSSVATKHKETDYE